MSEVTRRVRVTFLFFEMIMMLGLPAPRRVLNLRQRFDTWRWERRRTRSLPTKTRGLERLLRMNPGLISSPSERRTATR
jgi:hypothetical protein